MNLANKVTHCGQAAGLLPQASLQAEQQTEGSGDVLVPSPQHQLYSS